MIRYNSFQGIATIFLDRPEKSHAYTPSMLDELEKSIRRAEEYSVCVLSSTGGRVFCAGADKDSLLERRAEDALVLKSQFLFDIIANSRTVFIASMNGPAIAGGFELALACDLRVVHPSIYCSLPEVSLGLIPAAGGCTRLSKLVGSSVAREVVLGGGRITAERGALLGLFHRINENPDEEATMWAQKIVRYDPLALQLAKQTLNQPSLQAERMAEAILYERKRKKD